MTTRTQTRLFDTHAHAVGTVRDLEAAGFSADEVSIMGNNTPRDAADGAPSATPADASTEIGASLEIGRAHV